MFFFKVMEGLINTYKAQVVECKRLDEESRIAKAVADGLRVEIMKQTNSTLWCVWLRKVLNEPFLGHTDTATAYFSTKEKASEVIKGKATKFGCILVDYQMPLFDWNQTLNESNIEAHLYLDKVDDLNWHEEDLKMKKQKK